MSIHHIRQSSTTKFSIEDEEIIESLQDIPSNLDLALNGRPNQNLLSPAPKDNSLLDPEAFRRLSISTISSLGPGRARSLSPYPPSNTSHPPTWKSSLDIFCKENHSLFLVAISQLFGALMNVTTRFLELDGEGMNPFQILFARQGITSIFCTAWMWKTGVPGFPWGNKGVRGLLGIRAVVGFFGIFGMYYSLQYLPVADAVVITFLAPSVASYGCYLFLHEPFPRSAQYASLISLFGVVLIARPFSFFTSSSTQTTVPSFDVTNSTTATGTNFPVPTSAQRLSAICVSLVGVLGAAGAITTIRWIGSRAHPLLSVNYFSIFCTLISLLALTLTPIIFPTSTLRFALPANLRQWSMLLFLGICGFVMQYLLTKGLAAGSRAGGARATNMIYTNMLFALLLDRWIFGIVPGWWSLGGSACILGSAIWVAVGISGAKENKIGEGGVDGFGHSRVGRVEAGTEEEEMGMLSGEVMEGRDMLSFQEDERQVR